MIQSSEIIFDLENKTLGMYIYIYTMGLRVYEYSSKAVGFVHY